MRTELTGMMGLAGFWCFAAERKRRLAEPKVAPGGGGYRAGSKDGGCVYTEPCWRTQDGNPGIVCFPTSPGEHFGGKEVHACQHRHM